MSRHIPLALTYRLREVEGSLALGGDGRRGGGGRRQRFRFFFPSFKVKKLNPCGPKRGVLENRDALFGVFLYLALR